MEVICKICKKNFVEVEECERNYNFITKEYEGICDECTADIEEEEYLFMLDRYKSSANIEEDDLPF